MSFEENYKQLAIKENEVKEYMIEQEKAEEKLEIVIEFMENIESKIEKMEIINNNQVLINKIKEFKENLIEKSNTCIANNVLAKIKEHYLRNDYKIDMEELKFELFNLNNYYFIECANEEFMLKLNDFDTRYNSYTNSLDSEEKTLDTISSMTRYKIISYIENTPKEILEFALNFI